MYKPRLVQDTCIDCGGEVSKSKVARCRACYEAYRQDPPLVRQVCIDCGQRYIIADTAKTRREVCTTCSAERSRKRSREYIAGQKAKNPDAWARKRREITARSRAKRGPQKQVRTPEQRDRYSEQTRRSRYSEGRTCRDCGKQIYNGNQTGRCRDCNLAHMNAHNDGHTWRKRWTGTLHPGKIREARGRRGVVCEEND